MIIKVPNDARSPRPRAVRCLRFVLQVLVRRRRFDTPYPDLAIARTRRDKVVRTPAGRRPRDGRDREGPLCCLAIAYRCARSSGWI